MARGHHTARWFPWGMVLEGILLWPVLLAHCSPLSLLLLACCCSHCPNPTRDQCQDIQTSWFSDKGLSLSPSITTFSSSSWQLFLRDTTRSHYDLHNYLGENKWLFFIKFNLSCILLLGYYLWMVLCFLCTSTCHIPPVSHLLSWAMGRLETISHQLRELLFWLKT